MPVVQPAELWQESGRWQDYGPELLRFKDRHERDFVLQPTSEEVITEIARAELKSYRHLPVNFYQIQTKFRDELRPRFGVMRGREFVMKDGYSFHADYDDLRARVPQHVRHLHAHLHAPRPASSARWPPTPARSAAPARTSSTCSPTRARTRSPSRRESDYAANVELAEARRAGASATRRRQAMQKVPTPGKTTCEDVAALLKLPLQKTVKAVAVMHDDELHLLLVRGDHTLNEIKTPKVDRRVPLRHRGGDRGRRSAASRLHRPGGRQGQGDRRPQRSRR